MALVFPPSPNPGDTYSDVGRTWTWDGTMWSLTTPIAIDVTNVANAVPTSRTISTSGTGLSGGGDLTADRTITLDPSALAGDAAFDALAAIPTGGATGQVLVKDSGTNYDTAWDTPIFPSPATFADTLWVGAVTTAVAAGLMQENDVLNGSLVYLPAGTITDIGIEVTVAGSAGSVIRLGVYSVNRNTGTLLWDAGTIDGTSATSQSIGSGSIAISSGWYALVAVSQGSPATRPTIRRNTGLALFTAATNDSLAGASAFLPGIGIFVFGVSGALPSSPSLSNDQTRSQVSSRVLVKGTWT